MYNNDHCSDCKHCDRDCYCDVKDDKVSPNGYCGEFRER